MRKNVDPRLSIYNEKALTLMDSVMETNNEESNEAVSKFEAEKELQAEVKKYRQLFTAIDGIENMEIIENKGKNEDGNQLLTKEDSKPSEIQ